MAVNGQLNGSAQRSVLPRSDLTANREYDDGCTVQTRCFPPPDLRPPFTFILNIHDHFTFFMNIIAQCGNQTVPNYSEPPQFS